MTTAIKISRPLIHFSNEGQKLAIILENEVFQNLTSLKSVDKKCSHVFIYFNEKKLRKIQIIFGTEY